MHFYYGSGWPFSWRVQLVLMLLSALAGPARADPDADARAHGEAFARAWNAGDMQGALALYADTAAVVWPGQGEEARGKAEIEKLLARAFLGAPGRQLVLKTATGTPLGDRHLATVCHWESSFIAPDGKRVTSQVRSTEVLVKESAGWRYLVDHASAGLPPGRGTPPSPARRQRRAR